MLNSPFHILIVWLILNLLFLCVLGLLAEVGE